MTSQVQVKQQAIVALLNQGKVEEGLKKARELVKDEPDNADILSLWGNVEEQFGDPQKALVAYSKCIKVQAENPASYLSLGYLCAKLQKNTEAIILFSFLLEMAPNWFSQPNSFGFSETFFNKLVQAGRSLVQFYQHQHIQAVTEQPEVKRIASAVWPQTHLQPFQYKTDGQMPHVFYIPDLAAVPIWEKSSLNWASELEAQYAVIRAEFNSVVDQMDTLARPYLDSHFSTVGDFDELAGKENWTALDIYREGGLSPWAKKHFPKTIEILKELPLAARGEMPDEVFFSILKPGQSIPPHYGLSNHSLTCHLGIDVPNACTLSVGSQTYQWQEAELVAFDDTFIHSAKNESAQTRVVLLFSIWHPDLSEEEVQAVKRTFNLRHTWLQDRVIPSFD